MRAERKSVCDKMALQLRVDGASPLVRWVCAHAKAGPRRSWSSFRVEEPWPTLYGGYVGTCRALGLSELRNSQAVTPALLEMISASW